MKRRLSIFMRFTTMVVAIGCGPSVSTHGSATGAGSGSGAGSTGGTLADASSTGLMVCEEDALECDGAEFGTWRLSSADAALAAHFYLWREPGSEELQFVSRWFVDGEDDDPCIRNGTYSRSGDLDDVFTFEVLSQGGTVSERCGGDPGEHTFRLDLTRRDDCVGHVLELAATDSNGASPYAIDGEAVHCGCNTGYDPYGGQGAPLPVDTCVSP